MQHLGQDARAHPGALPGGEHNDRERRIGHGRSCLAVIARRTPITKIGSLRRLTGGWLTAGWLTLRRRRPVRGWGTRTRTETTRLQRPAGCRLPHPPLTAVSLPSAGASVSPLCLPTDP